MAFAANVSKPKIISKTRAGSIRTVELKGPLPKAMNIGDGNREKDEYMCRWCHGLKRGQASPQAKGPWRGPKRGLPKWLDPGPEEWAEPSPRLVACKRRMPERGRRSVKSQEAVNGDHCVV